MKLLMISGDRALAEGKHGAFYNTLEEFHKYWERIDVICPPIGKYLNGKSMANDKCKMVNSYFGNVFIHPSPWPLILQPLWILREGLQILKNGKWKLENGNWLMTVHEFPPFYNGIGARLLWQKIRIPYVLEIFHIPGHPRAASIKEVVYKFLFKLFIRFDTSKAKAVRVMNQKQVSDFLIKAGVPRDKIAYIPAIYIDLDIFKPTNLSKEYDLIFVGRLEKNKGIELLLKAIEFSISNFQFPMKCLIVGSGPLKNDLKFKIKNLKLQDNVLLHGWAKDSQEVAELINKSKILVMPSYNEGGPRVVLEAMACGVPVLATKVGIVSDLDSAVVQIDWNSEDMAKKASHILNNESEYRHLKQEGLEIAKQFEKKEAIKNYAEKLKEILG